MIQKLTKKLTEFQVLLIAEHSVTVHQTLERQLHQFDQVVSDDLLRIDGNRFVRVSDAAEHRQSEGPIWRTAAHLNGPIGQIRLEVVQSVQYDVLLRIADQHVEQDELVREELQKRRLVEQIVVEQRENSVQNEIDRTKHNRIHGEEQFHDDVHILDVAEMDVAFGEVLQQLVGDLSGKLLHFLLTLQLVLDQNDVQQVDDLGQVR